MDKAHLAATSSTAHAGSAGLGAVDLNLRFHVKHCEIAADRIASQAAVRACLPPRR